MAIVRERRGNPDLGAAIRTARSARGLSREGLGAKLGGIHPDTIGAWERGEWLPGPQNVRLLARLLELPVDRLEQLLVPSPIGVTPSATPDRPIVAGWREVLSWGWSAHDLADHLIGLDAEALGEHWEGSARRVAVEHWAPIYAQVPECWRLVCSRPGYVLANWTFLPLSAPAYEAYRTGDLLDVEIELDHLALLIMPGLYRAVVIDFVIRPAWTTPAVRLLLFRSLIEALAELARLGIFFDEVAAHPRSAAGKGLCRSLGMTRLGATGKEPGTDIYVLPLVPMPATFPLARDAELAALYGNAPSASAACPTVPANEPAC